MNTVGTRIRFGDEFLSEFRAINNEKLASGQQAQTKDAESSNGSKQFIDYLKDSVSSVDESQKKADALAVEVATGPDANLHETMLAATQAELSFNLMVQIRNKVLEAYQEVMRLQV
jgi:flagellar hook-basal body complex protein FliE